MYSSITYTANHTVTFFRSTGFGLRSFSLVSQVYLLQMERELQARGCPYLPYWDSARDSQEPTDSIVLSETFFGVPWRTSGRIRNGPFSASNYSTPVGGRPLVRRYNPSGTEAFYAQRLIDADFTHRQFSEFSVGKCVFTLLLIFSI